jgi:hypothetical protein
MLSRHRALILLGSQLLLLSVGCKDRITSGQDSRPLPPPEPPASAVAPLPRDDATAAPKKRPADDELGTKTKRPPSEAPAATPTAPATPAPVASTSAAAPAAPAVPAAPAASVPVLAAPSAACLSRCQGAMQGCLSAPVDGGVPGFGNLDLCKKAFEACQSACQKP